MELANRYPEILADLAEIILLRLENTLPASKADDAAVAIIEDIRLRYGGCLIYIPKCDSYQRNRRNSKIIRDFNGRNQVDLARRHGLSLSTIYDIIASERGKDT